MLELDNKSHDNDRPECALVIDIGASGGRVVAGYRKIFGEMCSSDINKKLKIVK